MPVGIVQWFDAKSGEGRVLSGSHRYVCSGDDMEPATRQAGCHVHFDVDRDGVTAVSVVARPRRRGTGTRTPRGVAANVAVAARRGGEPTEAEAEFRRVVKPGPMHLARWWATAVATGGIDEVMAMYSPAALVAIDGSEVAGPARLRSAIEALAPYGSGRRPNSVRGDDDAGVDLRWDAAGDSAPISTHLRFERGEIVDQQIATAASETEVTAGEGAVPVQLVVSGRVGPDSEARAIDKIRHVAGLTDEPVLFARVKLTRLRNPAATRPAIAEAALDVNGEVVRAQVSGDEMPDAIDRLAARLAEQVRQLREHRSWVRSNRGAARPGEWAHGDLPAERPRSFDRPRDEREIVRHTNWSGGDVTVDEAAFDLEMLDHDFHLFREVTTGSDSALIRTGPGVYVLRQVVPDPSLAENAAVDVSVDDLPTPELTLSAAIDLLDESGAPFVFFVERQSRRGCAVYLRYDGHYGLLTAARAEDNAEAR